MVQTKTDFAVADIAQALERLAFLFMEFADLCEYKQLIIESEIASL